MRTIRSERCARPSPCANGWTNSMGNWRPPAGPPPLVTRPPLPRAPPPPPPATQGQVAAGEGVGVRPPAAGGDAAGRERPARTDDRTGGRGWPPERGDPPRVARRPAPPDGGPRWAP